MKKFVFGVLMVLGVGALAQEIEWEKSLGGKHAEYLFDAVATPDYGFILVGASLSTQTGDIEQKTEGDFDYMLSKLDENGKVEWVKTFGGNASDVLKSVRRTYDGGLLLAGNSRSGISGSKNTAQMGQDDIWLLKLDMKGNLQWQKTFGGLGDDKIAVALPTPDGGYLMAGSSASDFYVSATPTDVIAKNEKSKGNSDFWLVKLDAQGKEVWQKTFGGNKVDVLRKAVVLANKNIVLAGVSNSSQGGDKLMDTQGLNDWWVLVLDENANLLWQKSYGGAGDDQLTALEASNDGNLLLGGYFSEKQGNSLQSDFQLIKVNTTGQTLWQQSYDEGKNDLLTDIVENKDGSLLLSGYSGREKAKKGKQDEGIEDYLVIKTDAEGNELWRQAVGGSQKEVLSRTIETRDGGYVLMGSQMPNQATGTNDANFYIVKLLDKDKPKKPKLPIEAMPNPTEEFTAVVLGFEYEKGSCSVVDLNGRVLQHFEIEGNRTLPISLKNYPDGVYIVNISTNKGSEGVKVLKVR